MFALRANESADPQPDGSQPSTNPQNIGAGFRQQTPTGTRHVDNFDDRVTYEASIYSDVPQAVSIGLGADVPSTGVQVAQGSFLARPFTQNPNPTYLAMDKPRSDVDAATVNVGNGGSFSEEDWRPFAGLPLSGTSDQEWAATTGDAIGAGLHEPQPYAVEPGVRILSERAIGIPDRFSQHPTQVQAWRPWDVELGAWPWTGDKSAQRSPVAAQPFTDGEAIHNPLPSPTGAGGPVGMTNELETKPLTFRTAPQYWDVGTDGAYVDSGV